MRKVFRRLGGVVAVVGAVATAGVAGPGDAGAAARAACEDPRVVSVEGYRAVEGTSPDKREFTPFGFTVSSVGCPQRAAVRYTTVAFTAGRADFVSQSGELSFPAGDDRGQVVTVQVVQDAEREPNECFAVKLFPGGGNVELGTDEAAGIIVDDDDKKSGKSAKSGLTPPSTLDFHCSE